MMAHDFQFYRCRTGDVVHSDRAVEFGPEVDLVEAPVTWTLDDFPFTEMVLTPQVFIPASTDVEGLAQRWLSDLDFMVEVEPDGVFTQTFHPQSIGRAARLRILERIIRRAKDHGATFSTVGAAVDTWKATH
mgnify:FL=1